MNVFCNYLLAKFKLLIAFALENSQYRKLVRASCVAFAGDMWRADIMNNYFAFDSFNGSLYSLPNRDVIA